MPLTCFHCGDVVPEDTSYTVTILGKERAMCCPGCQAVAELIVASGLSSYYQHRTEPARNMSDLPQEIADLTHYDIDAIQEEFATACADENMRETVLSVEGINCAACAWLIERHLSQKKGVHHIQVNTGSSRATLKWANTQIKLSEILTAFHEIGYKAYPFQPIEQEQDYSKTLQSYMRRMGVAGLASMQVMMYAIALYMDIFEHMPAEFLKYFRWVSLLLTLPVVFYAAVPFYRNAWNSLRFGAPGMDVPVSLAIILAFSASCFATMTHHGDVYFESISMFTFFLLVGRFFEMRARNKAIRTTANLTHLIPALATRLTDTIRDTIPAKHLEINDIIEVQAGAILPADGVLLNCSAHFDEALLTGESEPRFKKTGDTAFAGTVCLDQLIKIRVTHPPKTCQATQILFMQEKALGAKPRLAALADHIARYFVVGLLSIAAITWLYWHWAAPTQAFWITLSVLVATCPCALSLATPTAFTCATQRLTQHGILLKNSHILEVLPKISHAFFDKTGTLTTGKMTLTEVQLLSEDLSQQDAMDIAASLEESVNHPIAHVLKAQGKQKYPVENLTHLSDGITGTINDKLYHLGHQQKTNMALSDDTSQTIYLTQNNTLLAAFTLRDEIRNQSKNLLNFLKTQNVKTIMLTGDPSDNPDFVAQHLNINTIYKGLRPEDKLAHLHQNQQQGHVSLMVGDGVNDGPVLAGAHVSFAMASGTDLAKNSADALLLGDNIGKISVAFHTCKRTRRIILQNFAWALGYNLCILPLAVSGQVHPWMAALGMSLSSLVVIGNSLRLLRT